jgi:hypothetical protein
MSESKPKTVQAIFQEVQRLNRDERELLLSMLRQDEANDPVSDEITQAWIEESDRRLRLIEEGKAGWVDGEQALQQLCESIAK